MDEITKAIIGGAVMLALVVLMTGITVFVLCYRWNGRDRDWKVNVILVLLLLISVAATVPKG